MEIELLLFASLRDTIGSSKIKIDLPAQATVAILLERVGQEYPELQSKLAPVRVAIGNEFADETAIIPAGQEIALIPPVSGG